MLRIVAVVGASECSAEVAAQAEAVGAELARRGAVVVCGGLGGVMEAACRGAKRAGGTTVGILPSGDRREANPYVDIAVPTGLGIARNVLVVRSGEAVIAVEGRFGTLSEIALALSLGIPVVGLNTWSVSKDGLVDPSIVQARDPVDAVERALSLIGTFKPGPNATAMRM